MLTKPVDFGIDMMFEGMQRLAEKPVWLNQMASQLLSMIAPGTSAKAACPTGCKVVRNQCNRDLSCSKCGRTYKQWSCSDGSICYVLYACNSCQTLPC